MATEPTALLDFYYILVEVLFGSVFVSGIAVAVIIFLICMLGKVSMQTTIIWVFFFIAIFTINYIGALMLGLAFLGALVYAAAAFVNLFLKE